MTAGLPYLNLGCGSHFDKRWVNIDFSKTGEGVIAHNLLNGIPFNENTFEVVYHSHVLEHFPKDRAAEFISECYRVLKPGGMIRIAVPDLEQIVNTYNRLLALGKVNPDDEKIRNDYNWIVMEMYDQTVRNESGGAMVKYLSKQPLENEEFIFRRIGNEGRLIRQAILKSHDRPPAKPLANRIISKAGSLLSPKNFRNHLLKLFFASEYELAQLGRFRHGGEIHQWMYDIYSLGNLLKDAGFNQVQQMDFDESKIANWRSFSLDEVNNAVRKPDSLFVEAIK